jgi:hypothetical protein
MTTVKAFMSITEFNKFNYELKAKRGLKDLTCNINSSGSRPIEVHLSINQITEIQGDGTILLDPR